MKPSFSQLANCANHIKEMISKIFQILKEKDGRLLRQVKFHFFLNSLFKWSTCFCPCKEDEKSVTSHEPKFLEGVLNEV